MIAALGFLAAVFWFLGFSVEAPPYANLRTSYRPSEALLLDRAGEVLSEKRVNFRGRRLAWASHSEVSPAFWRLLVASEDKRFYSHHGVDVLALLHALYEDLFLGRRRGASTLTMQLARLMPHGRPSSNMPFLSSLWRKIQEMRLAWAIEKKWSKEDILEAYANLVTFRGEITGIRSAAKAFFAKDPLSLNLAQSALLVSALRSPSASIKTISRRAQALLPQDPEVPRLAQRLEAPAIASREDLAPHLAARLLSQKKPLFRSALDAGLQRFALLALEEELERLAQENVHDGAVVVLDNPTGEALAYVGGSPRFTSARYLDGAWAPRQAGSTLKPFLYALAFESRLLTLASLLQDEPVYLATPSGLYVPQDYDNAFKGWVSARTALASSLNVPAVRVLMLVGPERFATRLQQAGLSTVSHLGEHYGFSLALGSAEVRLLELANAYRALAQGGLWSNARFSQEDNPPSPKKVFSPQAAWLTAQAISDNAARALTFGMESVLATPFWSAVKTGTSKDMRDNWCVGFSSRYTVGVWVGNLDASPMRHVSGVSGAAPIWAKVMRHLHEHLPSMAPPPPPGVLQAEIEENGQRRREWFMAGTEMKRVEKEKAFLRPRILYPANGTVVALDPDIPPQAQRLLLEASHAFSGMRFEMDGKRLLPEKAPMFWKPAPGRHHLRLLDKGGDVLDEAFFWVKG